MKFLGCQVSVSRKFILRRQIKNIGPFGVHLVEKVSELLLSLHDLLPMFYLLVFDVLLLQPENTQI